MQKLLFVFITFRFARPRSGANEIEIRFVKKKKKQKKENGSKN